MMKRIVFALAWLCLMASPVQATSLSVACAANFTSAMKKLVALYEAQTGADIRCTFGSTGMLYGQIKNGAPYDLFFAADERRPALLHEQGLAEKPVQYAKGRVVLWSRKPKLFMKPNWREVVLSDTVVTVGIANPETAPYGASTFRTLEKSGILATLKPKFAYGKSVGISFQYAYAGAADAAFIALSQAISAKGGEGRHWPIPEARSIVQTACVLTTETAEAGRFMEWIHSATARIIVREHGYE